MSDLDWTPEQWAEFSAECVYWRGSVLIGAFAHYCYDWDLLPVDETCEEFRTCHCFDKD